MTTDSRIAYSLFMRETDPIAVLQAFCRDYPTQAEAAAALGVSAQYLSGLLNGRSAWSDAMLAKLGLRWAVVKEAR